MSSPSVQVQQPQPSGGTKGVSATSTDSGPANMSFDIVRCSRCQRSMSLENDSSPGVSLRLHGRLHSLKRHSRTLPPLPPRLRKDQQLLYTLSAFAVIAHCFALPEILTTRDL
ncbi:hypothetical protein FE257_001773 [Aspergillus nanangensis]|uniref:Uncharacterized protein n=1 Tax=Aspergillus nanangensis TaxID=2582783 RepID=A0AAD4GPG0_ASPNN|nr:hypothetical protein FE257_001773 [Aspergillus nanangensis]